MNTALPHDGLGFEGNLVEHPLGRAGQQLREQATDLLVLRGCFSGTRMGFRIVGRDGDRGARGPIH